MVPEAPALPLLRTRRGMVRGSQKATDLWFSREWLDQLDLDSRDIWLRQGKETKAVENLRRREAEAEGTVTDAVNSPPPSKRVTPVIIWIKWQKTGRRPPRPRPRPRPGLAVGGGGARACGTHLSFSQLLNLDE